MNDHEITTTKSRIEHHGQVVADLDAAIVAAEKVSAKAGPGDDAYAARLQVAVLHRQRDEMQSALAGEVELLDELVAEDAADAASTKTAKVAK